MIMSSLVLGKDLRGNVVWRPAECCSSTSLPVFSRHEESCETKVADLHIHILVQEDVSHLEITVDDAFGVHILDRTSHLDRPESYLGLRDKLPLLDHVHQRSIWAEFQNDVCAFLKGKRSVELDDIGVVHLGMDLEFCLEFLLHLLLWHQALHNLKGVSFLCADELSIIANGESSLS